MTVSHHPLLARQPQVRRAMTRFGAAAASLVLTGWWPGQLPAAPTADPVPNRIPRTTSAISIDGLLDEAAWRSAWTAELPYEVRPGENTPAPVRTEVLLTHDQSFLYVAFRAWDAEPSAIRAHLTDRDEAWSDDWVGVVLDTFNDQRRNYLFVVNPLGVQMDRIESWPGGSTPWDGIWQSAAQIADWGWSAELRVPFSSLRFQRSEGTQVWGFDAMRGYPRSVFRQMGSFPRDRSNNCYLCQALKIEGFAGVSPGRNLEIVPTLTSIRTDERPDFPAGDLVSGNAEVEGGLTARWGVTPNLTLSGTLNPDYSQVEADARQLDINEPFELFFDDKRPFFMEAADFFDTPLDVVYTRILREPVWGLKLTGKEGPHTVGSYVVEDEITNILLPGSQSSESVSLDQSNTSTVARYRHDLGERHTLGMLLTDRRGRGYSNSVAGIDGDLRLSETDRVVLQLLGSTSRYPDDLADEYDQPVGDFEDWAAELLYLHETRTWEWWAWYRDIGRDFRADLGFMPRVDMRLGEIGVGYEWLPTDSSWYSELDLKAALSHAEDQNGALLEDEAAVMFTYHGPLQSHSVIRPSSGREGYDGREFDIQRLFLHSCLKPNGSSHLWLDLEVGDQVDYDNTRPGDHVLVHGGLWYRIGRHLFLELQATNETMDVAEGWLYRANIAELTAAWQFNPRAFVRAILQRVDYDYNVELYQADQAARYRELFSQLLFSYKLNPQTVLFVGYSDNSYGDHVNPVTLSDRTVFVKLGYAWVL
jgi:hypothetical protein